MADEKLTQLTSLAGAQVPTDLMYIVDLSEVLPADQSKSTTVADLFNYYNKNTTDGSFQMQGIAAPGLSGAGNGKIYFDSTSNTFKVSQNGGAFFDIGSGNLSGSLTSGRVPYASGTTTLTDNAGLTFTPNALTIGTAASPGGLRLVGLTGNYWNLASQSPASSSRTFYFPDNTSPTTGNFLFVGTFGSTVQTDWSTGLTWSNSTKQITVTASTNAQIGLGVQNTNAGTAAECVVGFTANGGAISLISLTSTAFTTSGLYKANQLYWRGTTGITEMLFALDDASTAFKFGVNNVVAASINATSTEGLVLGIASTLTGRVKLYNSAGATYTQISAGNAASSLNYILPATSPTAGQFLQAGAPSGGNVTLTWATGSGGGAPADASYLVLGLNGTLTDERVFTLADTTLSEVDGGAGGNYTLGVNQANAFAWTAAHTWQQGTSQANALSILKASIGSAGQRDSDRFLIQAKSNDGTDRTIEARQYINVVSNDGVGSLFTIDGRNTFAGAGFNTLFTLNISSGDIVTPGTLTSGTASAATGALNLYSSGSANVTTLQAGAAASALTFVWPVVDPTAGQVLSASAPSGGTVTLSWATAGSGSLTVGTTSIASGTGGRVLYETAGNKLGEISGVTSDGTSLFISALNLQADQPTFLNDVAFIKDAIGAVTDDGINLVNTTAAASGSQQFSPGVRWTGNGFKTSSGGASQAMDAIAQLETVQGAAVPTSNLCFSFQSNGTGYTKRFTFSNTGSLTLDQTLNALSANLSGNLSLATTSQITWNSDLYLQRDAANTLAQRNGTNAQAFRVYNTYANSGTDYERLKLSWESNIAFLRVENGGTGSAARGLVLQAGQSIYIDSGIGGTHYFRQAGTDRWIVNTSGHFIAATDNTYDIGASGANRPRNVYAATSVSSTTIEGQYLQFASNRGYMSAPSNGVFTFTNIAGSNFDRLQFGGTTASFPSLKRSTNTIQIRLADDSAFAPITANLITAKGNSGASALARIFTCETATVDLGGFTVGGSQVQTNLGTAPTASVTDACLTYVADAAAGDAQLFARNEAGFVSQLTGNLYTLDQDYPATTTTLANITGGGIYGNLSANVQAGKSYNFRAVLLLDANATGGWKVAMGGTCTATTFRAGVLAWGTSAGLVATLQVTALGSTTTGSGVNAYEIIIEGYISVNAAGTLTVQFAQNSASGTSYVKEGSYFQCWLSNR